MFLRKHTPNVWNDIDQYISRAIDMMDQAYVTMNGQKLRMKETDITQHCGYEILGKLYGEGVLSPTANNVAFTDWNKPRYEAFEDRNLWSLYNCANEALKKVDNYNRVRSHFTLHHYLTKGFDAPYTVDLGSTTQENFLGTGYKDYGDIEGSPEYMKKNKDKVVLA